MTQYISNTVLGLIMKKKKLYLFSVFACMPLVGCHENFEQRAAREAKEYTEKYCPTPVQNCTRTDSVTFDIESKTFNYYCSVTDALDNHEVFENNKERIADALIKNIKENPGLRNYKKGKFCFAYILRSAKNPKTVYFTKRFTSKDYGNVKLESHKQKGNVVSSEQVFQSCL